MSPGATSYCPLPEGRVNVCTVGCATAPLAEAPVKASMVNLRFNTSSLAKVFLALKIASPALTLSTSL